jgi:hypothetical protein
LAASSGSDGNQAAWHIVAVAMMSFLLAMLLMPAVRNAMAHDSVYAALLLVVGPFLLVAIIVNARAFCGRFRSAYAPRARRRRQRPPHPRGDARRADAARATAREE